jgi:phospholipase/lecithinase/hemolysin
MSAVIRTGFLLAVVFAQSLAWAAPPAHPGSPLYDNLYVFGDSLSDTGNDLALTKAQRISPAIPPSEAPHRTYYKGRFSNGAVAVEYLWQSIRNDTKASLTPFFSKKGLALKGAVNFAFGGSTSGYISQTPGQFYVPGVLGQIDLFRIVLNKQQSQARTLYLIWTGANDYLAVPPAQVAQPSEVIANITKAVETLYALGARDFMILNLPDLGQTPLAIALGPQQADALSALAKAHNDLLVSTHDDLVARLEGTRITLVDIFSITQHLLSKGEVLASPPALAIISPETGAVDCLFRNPSTCPDVNLTAHTPPVYFWDVMHPTTLVHGFYGKAMFESLSKEQAP